MPGISVKNKTSLELLVTEYNDLPWYKKLFYPGALSKALRKYERSPDSLDSAFAVCDAFLNKTSFFQRWLFSSLVDFFEDGLASALRTLNAADLLTGDANFNAVVGNQNPGNVASALRTLNADGLLTDPNRDAVAGHQNPRNVASALYTLNADGLLTDPNRDAVAGHQNPGNVASALHTLNTARLLTGPAAQDNRDAVTGHRNPESVASALDTLNAAGLLTGPAAQANRDAVAGHQNPGGVAWALGSLNAASLLTGPAAQNNRDAVAGHQDPGNVASALRRLNAAGFLTGDEAQANFNAVAGHQEPWHVVWALDTLRAAGLLTRANFNAVAGHQAPESVAWALHTLNAAHLLTLTQDRFNLVAITHTNILCHPDTVRLWNSLAPHHLTQAHFTRIIEICVENQGNLAEARRLFINYVNHSILGVNRPRAGAVPVFNGGQSTHTASIHKTVSISAANLMRRYGDKIKGRGLDAIIHQFSSWINSQTDSSLRITAAKRCLERLIAREYSFTDPGSNVSTKQLLALVWLAFHDENQRQGSLADAKTFLIEGLYEAQRGYNLSESGVDNNDPEDRPICVAGTFNKIIEKGCGIHPDVELNHITSEGASLKFPIVVNGAAMDYLKGLAKATDKRDLLDLIDKIKKEANDNTVEPIWESIRDAVATKMFNEFKSLYKNNISSLEFVALVNTGVDVQLNSPNMAELEALIPKGTAATSLSRDGFFAAPSDPGAAAAENNDTSATLGKARRCG